jgi:hypothetical protein
MFIKISKADCRVFNLCGVHWASDGRNRGGQPDIHKTWLDKAVKSGLVKNYIVSEDGFGTIEFHEKPELFKTYNKTIMNEFGRGVIIRFVSALNELYQKGYDGWLLDLNNDLYDEYLDKYLQAMADINEIKSNIKLYKLVIKNREEK